MSSTSRPAGRTVRAVSIVLLACLLSSSVGAQDPPTARAALESLHALERRHSAALVRVDSVRRTRTARLDDSLRAGGRLVRFNASALSRRDQARLADGLVQAERSLTTRFGTAAAQLVDPLVWELRSPAAFVARGPGAMTARAMRGTMHLRVPTVEGTALGLTFDPPLRSDDVASLALRAAGLQLARLHPALASFAPTITLEESGRVFASAAQDLALSHSSIGARCAGGAIGACRTVLAPLGGASPRAVYFAPEDYPALVRASGAARTRRDSASLRDYERCLADDLSACTRVVARLPDRYPFRVQVRGSFAVHALELGGSEGLDRLLAARDRFAGDPVGLLTQVSGVDEEALIASWHTRVRAAGAARVGTPLAPIALTGALWSALLLVVATRRRPR